MAEPVPQTALELRNWLRGLKEQSGASYDDIARGIGEDSRVVKRWMTGEKPSVPRGDSLLRLLDYLEVSLDPPPPRRLALSLLGEIREVQQTLGRVEAGEGGERRTSLPEIDDRLERLAGEVARVIELLEPLAVGQRPGATVRRRGKRA